MLTSRATKRLKPFLPLLENGGNGGTVLNKKTESLNKGDPKFFELLDKIKEMHCKKSADYGDTDDIYANIRASEEVGVAAHKGAWIRGKDKVKRIDQFYRTGSLANESVEDSLLDLASYCLIALVLMQEEQNK